MYLIFIYFMFKNYLKNNKEIARAMFLYISFSILGPLLVIGGIGYLADKIFHTRFALFFSIFIAYLVSNFLMFKKLKKVNQEIEAVAPQKKDSSSSKNGYDDDDDEEEVWPITNKK